MNANNKSKQRQKKESSLLEQLNAPLRDFVNDFKTHGASVLQKVRETNPEKYLELSTKLLPLVAALNPGMDDFSDCKDMRSIGIKLLKSVGMDEFIMPEWAINEALEGNDEFIAKLQAIRAAAEGQIQ
jgi:hypothetical protein